jgi:hypothetical protein
MQGLWVVLGLLPACRKLALKNARKAIDNADSHEYFAEAGM